MKIHSNNFQLMDELINEARQESPLLNIKEIENTIRHGEEQPSREVKRFSRYIGITSIMVAVGLVVFSLLGNISFKSDNAETTAKQLTEKRSIENANSKINQQATAMVAAPKLIASNNNIKNHLNEVDGKNNVSDKLPAIADKTKSAIKDAGLNSKITSVKISDSFSLHSEKGGIAGSEDKRTSNREVSMSFNYKDEKVKMLLSGNELKEFSIGGRNIPSDKFKEYALLISEAKGIIQQKENSRQKAKTAISQDNEETGNIKLVQFFTSQLQEDNIVAKGLGYTFELTSSHLLINKAEQNGEAFQKYKNLYETKTGKALTAGTVYSYERGSKINKE